MLLLLLLKTLLLVAGASADDECERDLSELRRLVARRDIDGALGLTTRCVERFAGVADRVAVAAVGARVSAHIVIEGVAHPCIGARVSGERPHVVGLFLDGVFVARVERVVVDDDEESNYGLGAKSVLVVPLCPADECTYPGLAKPNATGFLGELLEKTSRFFQNESRGRLELEPATVLPVSRAPYNGSECGSRPALDYYAGKDPLAYDMMALAVAEEKYGLRRADFDFVVVAIPRCGALPVAGVGWIGFPGSFLNVDGLDYDQSLAHELGHNLGGSHASSSRDALTARYGEDWREYGNPFTVMGKGRIFDASPHFLLAGKLCFGWVPSSRVAVGEGDHRLVPVETPSSRGVLGVRLDAAIPNRHLFVEYREVLGGALVAWADVDDIERGRTGIYRTVLADVTPRTIAIDDAILLPGARVILDLGASTNQSRLVALRAFANDDGFTVSVEPATQPTATPSRAPSPRVPSPAQPDYSDRAETVVIIIATIFVAGIGVVSLFCAVKNIMNAVAAQNHLSQLRTVWPTTTSMTDFSDSLSPRPLVVVVVYCCPSATPAN